MNIVPKIPKRPNYSARSLLKEVLSLIVCAASGVLVFLNLSENLTVCFILYVFVFLISGYFYFRIRKKNKIEGEENGPIIH